MSLSIRIRSVVMTHLRSRRERVIERPRRAFTEGDSPTRGTGEKGRAVKKRTNRDRANSRDDHMLEGCSNLPRQRFSSTTSRQTCLFPLGLQDAAAYFSAPGQRFRTNPLETKALGIGGGELGLMGIGCGHMQSISAEAEPSVGCAVLPRGTNRRSAGLRTAAGPRFK